jgi:hypothetical protein
MKQLVLFNWPYISYEETGFGYVASFYVKDYYGEEKDYGYVIQSKSKEVVQNHIKEFMERWPNVDHPWNNTDNVL